MASMVIKKINRSIALVLEISCAFMLLLALLWLALMIRLSYGEMNVNYLTNSIEKGLNKQDLGFNFEVGNTALKWGGKDNPMEFEMRNVQIFREDNTPIVAVDKIGVQLSRRYLLIAKIVPRVIKIYGPALRVVRGEDESFSLNVNSAIANKSDVQNTEVNNVEEEKPNQGEFLNTLLANMKSGSSLPVISALENVVVSDASLFYEDKILNVGWKSKKANVVFSKKQGGINIDAIASLDADKDDKAYVKGSLFYSWDSMKSNGIVYFTSLNPSKFAQKSDKLDMFSDMDFDFKGSLAFELTPDFKLISSRFIMGADAGKFNFMDIYKAPIDIDSIYMKGDIDSYDNKVNLEEFSMNFVGAQLTASGTIESKDADKLITINAVLNNMPMDDLGTYWPDKLQDIPRSWVTGNIKKGYADKATLDITMLASGENSDDVSLIDLGGVIDFHGLELDYFNPLEKVTDISGQAKYNDKEFNIEAYSGKVKDADVTSAKVRIYDLDKVDDVTNAHIDISTSVKGPIITALNVIDSKPLEYPKKLGINSNNFSGDADINLHFAFPLYQNLTVNEVKTDVSASVTNVNVKDVIDGFNLASNDVEVKVDNKHIEVGGSGKLEEMPIDFKWQSFFDDKNKEDSHLAANIGFTSDTFKKFGLPDDLALNGSVPTDLSYSVLRDKSSIMSLSTNLSDASFTIPYMNFSKTAGVIAKANMNLNFDKNKKLFKISNIHYISSDDDVLGDIGINTNKSEISSLKFSKAKLGNNDLSLNVTKDDYFYKIDISGKSFDASEILSDKKDKSKLEVREKVTPIIADVNIDKMMTYNNKFIEKAKISLRTDEWDRIKKLEVDAQSGAKPLYVRYLPQPMGGYSLDVKASNAGSALVAFDVTSTVIGGVLEIKGYPDVKNGDRNLAGTVKLSDFTLINVPILGRLLNSMSLTGVLELLNGKGISFDKMDGKFWWDNKGYPDNQQTIRNIKIKDGRTSGASIGLTFEGDVDMWAKKIDMQGTVIPASGISKVVGQIPIVGDILTGGDGGGILAATYKIKGTTKDPNVSVNPLSVLAPGVIRKLFFE